MRRSLVGAGATLSSETLSSEAISSDAPSSGAVRLEAPHSAATLGGREPRLGGAGGLARVGRGVLPRASRSRGERIRPGASLWLPLAISLGLACEDDRVESVPNSVCASGKRWVGDFTADEEMYPGADCVDCHRLLDGPPLMAAGTVYGLPDPGSTRTAAPGCFGVEGARVSITLADGALLRTTTNRAGNFYFEGRPDSLVSPYRVDVEYTLPDGRLTRQSMKTQPSYGGCARCHGPAVPTPGVEPGGTPAPTDVIADVYPIYTGPVHE
jgi:hypothetical protein